MGPEELTPQSPGAAVPWAAWHDFVRTQFGVTLTEPQLVLFRRYFDELKIWNEKFNLVSVRSDEELLYRHFADSLGGIPLVRKHLSDVALPRMADLGTGAGLPGVPVTIALGAPMTLVESITKKTTFLREVAAQLPLPELEVVNDRAENLGQMPGRRASYDVVLSRAVSKFSPNLEIAVPLLKPGGVALVYKTEQSAFGEEGITSVERALNLLGARFIDHACYALPGATQTYCILVFKKTGTTPAQYPRRVGVPEKKPL